MTMVGEIIDGGQVMVDPVMVIVKVMVIFQLPWHSYQVMTASQYTQRLGYKLPGDDTTQDTGSRLQHSFPACDTAP